MRPDITIELLLGETERMRCPFGHAVYWEGRWKHYHPRIIELMGTYGDCPPGAEYPTKYYHVEGR